MSNQDVENPNTAIVPDNPENRADLAENPHTAIASESESEASPAVPDTPTRRRRKKLKRRFVPNFNIQGVYKLILAENTQIDVGCVVGETVTVEKPWMNIDKHLIEEHLDIHTESSEFLPIKKHVLNYTPSEILMGYIPDESKDFDEFYICVTEEARDQVNEIIEKMKVIQEERLRNAVMKKIKKWKCLGSDKEIEELKIKHNRSLIEVEIESKYPILPFKIQFRLVEAQDLRDGYMELRATDESVACIFKKRIDAAVQVAPDVISDEAQTTCTYPKNSFTQYEYNVPEIAWEESEKYVKDFMTENIDSFCDLLRVNGCIDLYSNDYENLVLSNNYAVKVMVPTPREYLCFIDKNLSAGKMISSICWHPMWTGCVIASYVDIAPPLYLSSPITTDQVFKAIHDTNPVLFWSFNDNLKPKLILETPRPIYSLSCCPYDPNLIIGGCVNGQVILWDITNKLNNVEEEEILNVEQQQYRDHMFSLMNWMKNIFDMTLVRPTAVSDLKNSHRGCINSISWMSPFHSVSKTGKIEELDEDDPHSLQFVSSAEDGTILIWDLLKKPIITSGGFAAVRKTKRLRKKPSALSSLESPYKILHLNLKPVYKINVLNPIKKRLVPISCSLTNFFNTLYEETNRASRKSLKLSDRLTYEPILKLQNSNPRKTFYLGTMEGDFIQGMWEGQEFDSGEVVNFEDCKYVHYGKYHDGPVVTIDYSPINDTIVTVGGRTFALWREIFPNRPILWRKGATIYTYGAWFKNDQSSLRLMRMDGYIELWTLYHQSKEPLNVVLMSNGNVNLSRGHERKLKYNVVGVTDYRGSLRLFYSPHPSPPIIKAKEEYMSFFLTREIERKKAFVTWQQEWNARHVTTTTGQEQEQQSTIVERAQPSRREETKKNVNISPGMRYLEKVQEQRQILEQERIRSIILLKKQLNTEDVLKKREPLRKVEEENEIKRRKQKIRLRESERVFKQQVAMLFPDVIKSKPPPPSDPYEDIYTDECKKGIYNHYHSIAAEADVYVREHPFSHDFSWSSVLRAGRERRKKLDDSVDKNNHGRRYGAIKDEKAKLIAAAAAAEAAKTAIVEEISLTSTISKSTLATNYG